MKKKTIELLGCSLGFIKKWIHFQFIGDRTAENTRSIRLYDLKISCSDFSLLDEEQKRKCFNWINVYPRLLKGNASKGSEVEF